MDNELPLMRMNITFWN